MTSFDIYDLDIEEVKGAIEQYRSGFRYIGKLKSPRFLHVNGIVLPSLAEKKNRLELKEQKSPILQTYTTWRIADGIRVTCDTESIKKFAVNSLVYFSELCGDEICVNDLLISNDQIHMCVKFMSFGILNLDLKYKLAMVIAELEDMHNVTSIKLKKKEFITQRLGVDEIFNGYVKALIGFGETMDARRSEWSSLVFVDCYIKDLLFALCKLVPQIVDRYSVNYADQRTLIPAYHKGKVAHILYQTKEKINLVEYKDM